MSTREFLKPLNDEIVSFYCQDTSFPTFPMIHAFTNS